jgi:hypothetical protein
MSAAACTDCDQTPCSCDTDNWAHDPVNLSAVERAARLDLQTALATVTAERDKAMAALVRLRVKAEQAESRLGPKWTAWSEVAAICRSVLVAAGDGAKEG